MVFYASVTKLIDFIYFFNYKFFKYYKKYILFQEEQGILKLWSQL